MIVDFKPESRSAVEASKDLTDSIEAYFRDRSSFSRREIFPSILEMAASNSVILELYSESEAFKSYIN